MSQAKKEQKKALETMREACREAGGSPKDEAELMTEMFAKGLTLDDPAHPLFELHELVRTNPDLRPLMTQQLQRHLRELEAYAAQYVDLVHISPQTTVPPRKYKLEFNHTGHERSKVTALEAIPKGVDVFMESAFTWVKRRSEHGICHWGLRLLRYVSDPEHPVESQSVRKMMGTLWPRENYELEGPLPPYNFAAFCGLHNLDTASWTELYRRKVDANQFKPCKIAAHKLDSALFVMGSCFNHSCIPNAEWRMTDEWLQIVSIKPIKAGEEITIGFVEFYFDDKTARKLKLYECFKFWCQCPRCSEDAIPDDLPWPSQGLLRDRPLAVRRMACCWCGAPEGDHLMKVCGQCKMTRYCGYDCQKKHWKVNHKRLCPSFLQARK